MVYYQSNMVHWCPIQAFTVSFLALLATIIAPVCLAAPVSAPQDSNADEFNDMLDQYDELQQQTMTENLEMQKAQAFWNPLESMSKEDATSK